MYNASSVRKHASASKEHNYGIPYGRAKDKHWKTDFCPLSIKASRITLWIPSAFSSLTHFWRPSGWGLIWGDKLHHKTTKGSPIWQPRCVPYLPFCSCRCIVWVSLATTDRNSNQTLYSPLLLPLPKITIQALFLQVCNLKFHWTVTLGFLLSVFLPIRKSFRWLREQAALLHRQQWGEWKICPR